jgi:hypothetical protein
MRVDLRILGIDPERVVLRRRRNDVYVVLPAAAAVLLLFKLAMEPELSYLLRIRSPLLYPGLVALAFLALALYLVFFSMWTQTTFRSGSDHIERQQGGLVPGRIRQLGSQDARVKVGGRQGKDRQRQNWRPHDPPGLAMGLFLRDGRRIRLGIIDDGNAMLLADRLNAILAPTRSIAPPAP